MAKIKRLYNHHCSATLPSEKSLKSLSGTKVDDSFTFDKFAVLTDDEYSVVVKAVNEKIDLLQLMQDRTFNMSEHVDRITFVINSLTQLLKVCEDTSVPCVPRLALLFGHC